jgi:hypothetical protein
MDPLFFAPGWPFIRAATAPVPPPPPPPITFSFALAYDLPKGTVVTLTITPPVTL